MRDHRAAIAPYGESFADLAELQAWTDERVAARAAERRCPATGTSVAEAWARERPLLTPPPETAPEPFEVAVGVDGDAQHLAADAAVEALHHAVIRHVGGGASLSCRSPPGLGYGETIRDMGHREHASAGRPTLEPWAASPSRSSHRPCGSPGCAANADP